MRDLTVTTLQTPLLWESPADNRRHFERLIYEHGQRTDLIVLPEMFTTGFSMNALGNAEPVGGPTYEWLAAMAKALDVAITGSVAIEEGGRVYNRMLFATPESMSHYDKRHLFRMAGEHERYAAGDRRVIVQWRDWRIKLEVCYDLRFPVFSRNCNDYDMVLYVANWPARRAAHWRALLPARAIENSAVVVGVNRVGSDANGLDYSGDSMIIGGDGTVLLDMASREEVVSVTVSAGELLRWREQFPVALDADRFSLHDLSD